jgi:hypothetical protein
MVWGSILLDQFSSRGGVDAMSVYGGWGDQLPATLAAKDSSRHLIVLAIRAGDHCVLTLPGNNRARVPYLMRLPPSMENA